MENNHPPILDLTLLDDQPVIIRRVESLVAHVECLDIRYLSIGERVALLAKAFRGELVEHDAEDESAEELLDRIRAQQMLY